MKLELYDIICYSKKIWDFIVKNSVIIILLLIYFFFHHFWESQIGNHIVDKFLCHFESSWLVSLFFIISGCVIIVFSYLNRGKGIKQRTKLLCLVAIGFWVYYRCFHNLCGLEGSSYYLSFTPSRSYIKYVDIILIYAICKLISPYLGKRKNEVIFDGGYIIDRPVEWNEFYKFDAFFSSNDGPVSIQKRSQLADSAIHKILQTDTEYSSFTFGINAQWGAGKTTFMNMMKKSIISENGIIIIDFNPWLYAQGNDLVSVFFEELSKTLKKYDHSLAKNLINYSKIISAFDTHETKIISSIIDLVEIDNSLQDTKKQIVASINSIKKKIVVFVDDLDRLVDSELMEMFKLIRNVSDFPYMYFIAAYDKSYIIQCLKSKMSTKEVSFVEKIFQVEFHLPPYNNVEIREHLYQHIVNYIKLKNDDKDELKRFILNNNVGTEILKSITNIREVIRLVNSFSSSYFQLRGDVYVIDLLLFELFKTKYSSVYELFEHKTDEMLVLNEDFYQLYQTVARDDEEDKKGTAQKAEKKNDNDSVNNSSKIDLVEYIKSHLEKLHIDELDEKSLLDLLDFLFSLPGDEKTNHHRINHKDCFERYIRLSVFETEVSDEEFNELFDNDKQIDEIIQIIKTWSNHRSYSLSAKIQEYKPKNEKEYRVLMHILFFFITLDTIHKIDYNSIDSKLALATTVFSKNVDAQEFIHKCLYANDYYPSIALYLSYLCNNYDSLNHGIKHLFDRETFIEYQSRLLVYNLHQYLKISDFDIIPYCFETVLRYSIKDFQTSQPKQFNLSDEYNSELVEIMKVFVEKRIITDTEKTTEFIHSIIIRSSSTEYTIMSCAQYIWGSWNGFYNVFSELYHINVQLFEFTNFLEKFKNNNYKPVRFQFTYIKPNYLE